MYHINPQTKAVGHCDAQKGNCPFGGASGADNHFESQDGAYREAERQLSAEYGQPALSKTPKMIDSFEVWQAKRLGTQVESSETPGIPLSYYKSILPVKDGELAKYCHEKGLTMEETNAVGDIIKRFRDPYKGGPSVLVTRALRARVSEAEKNCEKIDEQLKNSGFFTTIRTQGTSKGVTLSAFATVGNEDLITHMSENGNVRFEVYEHDTGEAYGASQPSAFTDDGDGSIAAWINNYNAYREHLWSRTLWEKEKRNRVTRAGSLNL